MIGAGGQSRNQIHQELRTGEGLGDEIGVGVKMGNDGNRDSAPKICRDRFKRCLD